MTDMFQNTVVGTLALRINVERFGGLREGLYHYGPRQESYVNGIINAASALDARPPDPTEVLRRVIGP